jgi:hypothetical protein
MAIQAVIRALHAWASAVPYPIENVEDAAEIRIDGDDLDLPAGTCPT